MHNVDFTPEQLYRHLNRPSLHSWNPGSSELEISPEKAITLLTLGTLREGSRLPSITQLVEQPG